MKPNIIPYFLLALGGSSAISGAVIFSEQYYLVPFALIGSYFWGRACGNWYHEAEKEAKRKASGSCRTR